MIPIRDENPTARRAIVTILLIAVNIGIYFGITEPVRDYRDAVRHQRGQMLRFVKLAIEQGVYFHDYGGAACHHGFCAAMTLDDVDEVLNRLDGALARMKQ